jgi:hypothetical protein
MSIAKSTKKYILIVYIKKVICTCTQGVFVRNNQLDNKYFFYERDVKIAISNTTSTRKDGRAL